MKIINLNGRKSPVIRITESGKYVAYLRNVSGTFTFELRVPDINLEIIGLFEGSSSDEYRIHTVQHHIAPDTTSNLLIKGVFNDQSKFHYTGLVKIDKGAQNSHAYQKNQNLLMSPGAFVESEPFLEILANEVFCTHGSTTGKINEDELIFLASRGIPRKQAEDLVVRGFLREISERIEAYETP